MPTQSSSISTLNGTNACAFVTVAVGAAIVGELSVAGPASAIRVAAIAPELMPFQVFDPTSVSFRPSARAGFTPSCSWG
jgi:hypothetical protein